MLHQILPPTIFSKPGFTRAREVSVEVHSPARQRVLQVGCILSCMAAVTVAGDGSHKRRSCFLLYGLYMRR